MVDRIKHDAPVLVIGLGRFGAATAGQLDRLGREVLAVDDDEALVQKWAERVTHAVVADARNIDALRQIGAQDFSTAVCAVGSSIVILQITKQPFEYVLFDVISAFATCGLSTGLTAELPPEGVYVLAATMFMGRVGTVTLAAALAASQRRQLFKRPEERPIVG